MKAPDIIYEAGLVSVVIPTYKRSVQLGRAVQSILDQTYKNVEVLIVDDNIPGDEFSNALEEVKDSFKDERVQLIRQDKHINGAAARNAGIASARGEYIAFLDDDDWWEKEKIEHQLNYMNTYGQDWGGVSCLIRFYSHGKLRKVNIPYKEGYLSKDVICRRIGIGTGSPILKRVCLDKSGYFDPSLNRMQDLQLFAVFCHKFKMGLLKEYPYNRDVDDTSNQPSIDKLKQTKAHFFDSINNVLRDFSESDRKTIEIMTSFDMAYNYWNNGMKKEAIKHALRVVERPVTVVYALERIITRIREVKFRNYYEKKYSKSV